MRTKRAISLAAVGWILISAASLAIAQAELPQQVWTRLQSENFSVISQASDRQTGRFVRELETWRRIAAYQLQWDSALPKIPIPNYVFLFDDEEDFAQFTLGDEKGFFYTTPRANFMGVLLREDGSLLQAKTRYAHFLIRNFSDLSLPRWYEAGMTTYLARINVDGERGEMARPSAEGYSALAQVSNTIPMGRLLYRDDALASPRLIQYANLKSEALLYYLLHGFEEDQFPDRRAQLTRYLQLLAEGRTGRFAFDQSFDLTTAELEAEYVRFLEQSRRPRIEIEHGPITAVSIPEPEAIDEDQVAILLGELGLNSGRLDTAKVLFTAMVEADTSRARAYSGLGDALRFDDVETSDQLIAAYFEKALSLEPENLNIILDLGEYWESELSDCDKTYSAARRQNLYKVIEEQFNKALAMAPENPEVNLAMAQFYLFPEQDWRQGISYQEKAFKALPADGFIMEQAVKYAIAAENFDYAELLIAEMAQPLFYFGEPEYVTDLRVRLLKKQRSEPYDVCAEN